MALNAGHHAVIVSAESAVERIAGSNTGFCGVFTACINVIKLSITFTDNGFPHQNLRCHIMGKLICISIILRSPTGGNISLIAILHDTTEQHLDRIRFNGVVIAGRIIIPEVLTKTGIGIADLSVDTRLNAVTHLTFETFLSMNGPGGILFRVPAVHEVLRRVSPRICAINLVCIAVSRKRDHIRFRCLRCGKCSCGSCTKKCREAHQECKQSRHASLNK